MARGLGARQSNSYPAEYMKVFQHVLNTNEPVEIHKLKTRGQCISMRQSMFSWRKALQNEGNPMAGLLYAVTISVLVKPTPDSEPMELRKYDATGRPKNAGHWFLCIRPRDKMYQDALSEIAELPEVGVEEKAEPGTNALNTINRLFSEEGESNDGE